MSLARTLAIGAAGYLAAGVVANLLLQRERDKALAAGPPTVSPVAPPSLVTPPRVLLWPVMVVFNGGMK